MSKLGDTVRRLRLELGMSQAELARKAGFKSAGSIGDIEQGKQPTTRNIDLLAKALQTTAHHLRTGQGEELSISANEKAVDEREWSVIKKYRLLSGREKERVEAFLMGIKPSRRGPRRPPSHQGSTKITRIYRAT